MVFLLVVLVLSPHHRSAAEICAEADQQDRDIAEMIRRNAAELGSGDYQTVEKREKMARDEQIQQSVAATWHSTCHIARGTEQLMAEYAVLSERYDLRHLRSYSPAERQAVFVAANVPPDGPQTRTEELRVLKVFRDNPGLYK